MAPDVLLALVAAEVVLWVDGRRLCFRAPVGALDARLRAAAGRVRGSLIALVKAGAVLPVERGAWPAEAFAELEERAGMLLYDAGLPPLQAEREAERLVRVSHARAFVGRAVTDQRRRETIPVRSRLTRRARPARPGSPGRPWA